MILFKVVLYVEKVLTITQNYTFSGQNAIHRKLVFTGHFLFYFVTGNDLI